MANDPEPESPAQPGRKPRRGPTRPTANVESVFGRGQTEINYKSPETRDERASRLKREDEAKAHDLAQEAAEKDLARRKDWLAFRVFMTMMIAIGAASLIVLLVPSFPDDARKWAYLSLTTILSLTAGYLVGKKQG